MNNTFQSKSRYFKQKYHYYGDNWNRVTPDGRDVQEGMIWIEMVDILFLFGQRQVL